jgi:hypothetical protein
MIRPVNIGIQGVSRANQPKYGAFLVTIFAVKRRAAMQGRKCWPQNAKLLHRIQK